MGSLRLPETGTLYLDANCFIYGAEKIEPYCLLLQPAWQAAREGRVGIVTSELTLLEALVKPFRAHDALMEQLYRSLLRSREIRLLPANAEHWEMAARIRASSNLKTPDALHAATALIDGCSLFLTNDPVYRRLPDLHAVVLDDLTRE